ncbi:MAG TPA: hypothetical protein PLM07_03185 [Candidatus Rifleibacterium sp.]|nr:hypothetical protein [Candidatus Rifleibacterium sp.]HPT44890.1 hypothetical protein [Candidatus Rifleibacterium sp.]
MHDEKLNVTSFFELRLRWLLPSAAVVFIAMLILNSQKLLLQLPGPAFIMVVFLVYLTITCYTAGFITNQFSRLVKIGYPTVILWFYPTIAMLVITAGSWGFLIASNRWLGRGFWSDWLGLTGQDTTSFFSACFAAMLVFVGLQFVFSMLKVLRWILDIPAGHMQAINASINPFSSNVKQEIGHALEQVRNDSDKIREQRGQANRLNRSALLLMMLIAAAVGTWIIYYRPALILYYRAEIQLRTFREPAAAWETFRHLVNKYPDYRFIDTVTYRMAWILDRRLERYDEAATAYEDFLRRFSMKNVWADEAVAALVRLNLDRLNHPDLALHWIDEYLRNFPGGVMFLHMKLYRVRALNQTGAIEDARRELALCHRLYTHQKIQIINSEDRLIDLISFADALAAEVLQPTASE